MTSGNLFSCTIEQHARWPQPPTFRDIDLVTEGSAVAWAVFSFNFAPRTYAWVDCVDPDGNGWRHLASDPEETAREIRRLMLDVTVTVRERKGK